MAQTQIVEISQDGRLLRHFRGFLLVEQEGVEIGRIPWQDICAILLTAPDGLISKYSLMTASEFNIPVVVMGKNYHPIGILSSLSYHGESKNMLEHQIEASSVFSKNMWQALIKQKISGQAFILRNYSPFHGADEYLYSLANSVASGDTKNNEAIAASYYWRNLFEEPFYRRGQDGDGFNTLLNYAYAIMRAVLARAVIASGLNPALGVHHHNKRNPFCLVDDLIEVFRPIIDGFLLENLPNLSLDLTPADKKILAQIPALTILNHDNEQSTIATTAYELVQSYANSLKNKKIALRFPNFNIG